MLLTVQLIVGSWLLVFGARSSPLEQVLDSVMDMIDSVMDMIDSVMDMIDSVIDMIDSVMDTASSAGSYGRVAVVSLLQGLVLVAAPGTPRTWALGRRYTGYIVAGSLAGAS